MVDRDTGTGPTPGGFDLDSPTEATEPETRGGVRTRVRARAGRWVSLRAFLGQVALALAGALAVGALLPLGSVGDLLGIVAATFLGGLVTARRRYLEAALAGAAVGGLWALLGNLVLALAGVGLPVVTVGVGGGVLAALLGHYLGRDLRAGLTREV